MKTVVNTMLDPTRRSNDAREFESALRRRIVGQDQAVEKVVEIYQMFLAGLNPPGRPVGNLLFLGPPVRAKPVVEAMAEALRRCPRLHQD
jgi:ATP-dependent Clp protease ATP-binding subunit ClpA